MSVALAEGSSILSECSDDSSVLLDLSAMFPSLDHEVIVTVLQAHEGRMEAVVDYLMNVVGGGGEGEEAEELQGPFSDDIGGPPEIVPSFLQEPPAEDIGGPPEIVPSFLQEPAAEDIGGPPEIVPSFLPAAEDDDDPLPTYEQACMPIELGPPPYTCVAFSPAAESLPDPTPSGLSIREHCVQGQQETQISSREHCLPRETQWPTHSHQGIPSLIPRPSHVPQHLSLGEKTWEQG